jgi:hypothetical protein
MRNKDWYPSPKLWIHFRNQFPICWICEFLCGLIWFWWELLVKLLDIPTL